jgi:hypothetical protein
LRIEHSVFFLIIFIQRNPNMRDFSLHGQSKGEKGDKFDLENYN